MTYIKILAFAIALYLVLKAAGWIIFVFIRKTKVRTFFLRIVPVVEVVIWFSFSFWAFYQLFRDYKYYDFLAAGLVTVIVAITGWYLLRDIVSGIILKADNAFEPGQMIDTSIINGTIKKLGFRSMQIVTGDGEEVCVNYTRLINENIKKPSESGKYIGRVINLKIDSKYPAEKIQDMLLKRMLELPWIISGNNIKVKMTRAEDHYNAEIHYQSISPDMIIRTEENLLQFVKESFT